jgi:hypothetical protein
MVKWWVAAGEKESDKKIEPDFYYETDNLSSLSNALICNGFSCRVTFSFEQKSEFQSLNRALAYRTYVRKQSGR